MAKRFNKLEKCLNCGSEEFAIYKNVDDIFIVYCRKCLITKFTVAEDSCLVNTKKYATRANDVGGNNVKIARR